MATNASNPFYVSPLGGQGPQIAENLAGIGQVQEQRRKEQQALDRQQAAKDALRMAYQSGDPNQMAEVSIEYPEVQSQMEQLFKFSNDRTKPIVNSVYSSVLANEENPQAAIAALESGISQVEAAGGNPTNMRRDLVALQSGREGAFEQIKLGIAGAAPDLWKAYKDTRETSAPTPLMKNLKAAGYEPGSPQYQAAVKQQLFNKTLSGGTKPTSAMQEYQYYQKLKKTDPDGAKAFGIERGYVQGNKELSVHLQKRLSEASDQSMKSTQSAGSLEALADDFDGADVGGGVFSGKWGETFKDLTGTQDATTELRKKYNAIRASSVVQNLPPGAASDKDIEMAMSGFPTENAKGDQIASFLRGLAKLERMRADYNEFKASYVSENRSEIGLLKSWRGEQEGEQPPETPEVIEITTQEQFDALPSGAVYLESGVQYRKP